MLHKQVDGRKPLLRGLLHLLQRLRCFSNKVMIDYFLADFFEPLRRHGEWHRGALAGGDAIIPRMSPARRTLEWVVLYHGYAPWKAPQPVGKRSGEQ